MSDDATHPGPGETPSVFATLRHDHHQVLERLALVEPRLDRIASQSATGDDEQALRAFVAYLEAQLATHMRVEDEIVYPALESTLPAAIESLAPLRGEHRELRSMLASLRNTLSEPPGPARDEQIGIQAADLAELLRIHIRKEEAIVFAVAERLMQPGERSLVRERFARIGLPVTTDPPRAPRTSKGISS
jgi:hemerythrin-like domain-containing protein